MWGVWGAFLLSEKMRGQHTGGVSTSQQRRLQCLWRPKVAGDGNVRGSSACVMFDSLMCSCPEDEVRLKRELPSRHHFRCFSLTFHACVYDISSFCRTQMAQN